MRIFCVQSFCEAARSWCHRSEFSDDFKDAEGFGWEIPGQPKFHWKTLIQKKVLHCTTVQNLLLGSQHYLAMHICYPARVAKTEKSIATKWCLQAKEIARLNSVYNGLLKDAGVEFFGEFKHLCSSPCACSCCAECMQMMAIESQKMQWPGPAASRAVLLDAAPCAPAEGWGEFVDPHTVKISLSAGGEKIVTAQTILIATGGKAVKAPIEGAVSTVRHAVPRHAVLRLCLVR